jgi:hypothetical protein
MLPLMRAGLVKVLAADPKLMELAFGRVIFDAYGAYAADPAAIAAMLEAAVADMLLAAIQRERRWRGCVFAGERVFRGGSGCGGVACDDTVSVSVSGRPSPLPFPEVRGGP